MTAPTDQPRAATPVDAFAEEHLRASAALDPVAATLMGLSEHADRLTDYSPEGHAARAEQRRSAVRALDTLAPVDATDVVTLAALRDRLGVELALYDSGAALADLNNIACPVQTLREVFDLAPTGTAEDWAAITARLAALPGALEGYRRSLQQARRDGWVPAARQVRVVAEQADEFAAPEGFFRSHLPGLAAAADGIGATERARLAGTAESAAASYTELAGWLRAELLGSARPDDAVGRERYALHARAYLGTDLDLDGTYAWGLAELDRIEARMAAVADAVVTAAGGSPGSGGSTADRAARIAAGIALLEADPARTITGPEAFRDWMQQLSDTAVKSLDGTHFDLAPPIRTLTCRLAPSSSGAIYYTPPSEDFSRPGQMWWAVPAGVEAFSTWRETSTVYHEGVPGHHLQLGTAVALQDRLNRWRRMGTWVSGHGEGWALYAERLMEELGFLEDPGDLMGMLDAHALRACRVVVDLGVHLRLPAPDEVGGGTWDADKAWAFLRAHTRTPQAQLQFELTRYLGWPAQAISYKVGERVWLELREQVRAREGADFDLRRFHRRALALGSVGLDVLRAALLEPAPEPAGPAG